MSNKTDISLKTFFGPASFLLILWSLMALACTASITTRETKKPVVNKEAAIFDKRFDNLTFKDIDLRHLWIEGSDPSKRENITVHNNTFAEIAENVRHGVVNLYTRRLEKKEVKFGISPNDLLPIRIPILSKIFDIVPFQIPIPFKTEAFSLGSGFIINEQGYILTNAHVIHNATDIHVVLAGGEKEYPAKIIGMDRVTDTALIKIEPDTLLTVLPLSDSDELRTGEMVIAVGNPLGLMHSVTSGIISAKERVAPKLNGELLDFIQTDSAINPGSSGGPLLNLYGEVVGINTAIVTDAQSIGFAIPINTVKEVMPMLVLGQTERGWFGAKALPLGTDEASDLGYTGKAGVLVVEVEKESPAEKAGLRPKDIIVELNGRPLKSFLTFRRNLLGLAPGQKIHMIIFRQGETKEISGTLIKKISKKTG
jgi:S1-C subfamily serine protease